MRFITAALVVLSAAACAGVDACFNVLPTISGTSTDPGNVKPPSIQSSFVSIRVKDNTTGDYFDQALGGFSAPVEQFNPGALLSIWAGVTWSTKAN